MDEVIEVCFLDKHTALPLPASRVSRSSSSAAGHSRHRCVGSHYSMNKVQRTLMDSTGCPSGFPGGRGSERRSSLFVRFCFHVFTVRITS